MLTYTFSFFGSFGYIDVSTNEPYADMCAAAGGPDEPWTRLEGSEGCATSEEHCRYLSVKDDCMGALRGERRAVVAASVGVTAKFQ